MRSRRLSTGCGPGDAIVTPSGEPAPYTGAAMAAHVSAAEAARLYGASDKAVRRWIRSSRLRADKRDGASTRSLLEPLTAALERSQARAAELERDTGRLTAELERATSPVVAPSDELVGRERRAGPRSSRWPSCAP